MQIIKFCNYICRSILSVAWCCYGALRTTLIIINHHMSLGYSKYLASSFTSKAINGLLFYGCLLSVTVIVVQFILVSLRPLQAVQQNVNIDT